MAKKKKSDKFNETEFIQLVKERLRRSVAATQESYESMKDDLSFLNGEQWDSTIKNDRKSDGRPCLTINKLPTFIDQIIGDQRMNRPQIKIKPVDSGGDKNTAEIIQGLIKNIEVQSDANIAYDTAFDAAVQCGFGVFRISSEYISDDSFDQELRILPMSNQFTAYYDPDAQNWSKDDGDFWIITEKMSRLEFQKKYPNVDLTMFDAARDANWGSEDEMRVAEYFWKEYKQATLRLYVRNDTSMEQFSSMSELNQEEHNVTLLKERDVEVYDIMWARVSGAGILEGPSKRPGKFFPIIPVFGKNINIENKIHYRGAVRNSKDSQRLYNYNRSASAEVLALAPKSPYILTPKQVQGHEGIWKASNKKNFTYLLYNPDPMAKGVPQRQPPNPVSTGIQQEVIISDQELHDTTGLQRSSLGKQGNEKSGKAIQARQKEGDVGNYQFTDNLTRAMTYAGKVLIDLIPVYYDTERVIRIFKEDGTDVPVWINKLVEGQPIYDLTTGKYDAVVSIGPSFTTQRQEAADSMIEFIQYYPDAGPLIGDLIAKNQDWPGADIIEKRLKAMLPPHVIAAEEAQPGQEGQSQLQQQQAKAQAKQQALEETMQEMEIAEKEAEVTQARLKAEKIEAEIRNIEAKTDEVEFRTAAILVNGRATEKVQ